MVVPNKVAIVTGAGTGIGKACALALLKNHYFVTLVGRRQELLEEAVALSGLPDSHYMTFPGDVSDVKQVDALFTKVKERFGRLDVLFNNAGRGTPMMPFDEIPFELWEKTVNVNLTGTFLCSQRAFKMMREQSPQGGRIINNGSISAHTPRPFSIGYTSTKHAVTGLTKSISLDTRQYNIACGQIDIGNAETPMTERMTKGVLQPDGSMRPEPRMDVNHVAESIVQMVGFPLDTNVQFMTIMARTMPFIGRG